MNLALPAYHTFMVYYVSQSNRRRDQGEWFVLEESQHLGVD